MISFVLKEKNVTFITAYWFGVDYYWFIWIL